MGLLEKASLSTQTAEGRIFQFFKTYKKINCIAYSARGLNNSKLSIQNIIDKVGTLITLPQGDFVILMKESVDRELVSHRLSKSLNINPILSLHTDNPEILISKIGKV